jgi:predicted transcriptional regulator
LDGIVVEQRVVGVEQEDDRMEHCHAVARDNFDETAATLWMASLADTARE